MSYRRLLLQARPLRASADFLDVDPAARYHVS